MSGSCRKSSAHQRCVAQSRRAYQPCLEERFRYFTRARSPRTIRRQAGNTKTTRGERSKDRAQPSEFPDQFLGETAPANDALASTGGECQREIVRAKTVPAQPIPSERRRTLSLVRGRSEPDQTLETVLPPRLRRKCQDRVLSNRKNHWHSQQHRRRNKVNGLLGSPGCPRHSQERRGPLSDRWRSNCPTPPLSSEDSSLDRRRQVDNGLGKYRRQMSGSPAGHLRRGIPKCRRAPHRKSTLEDYRWRGDRRERSSIPLRKRSKRSKS